MESMRDMALALGLGFSVSQAPILLLMMLYLPEPTAIVYNVKPVNGTLEAFHGTPTPMSPWYLSCSLVVTLFAFVNHQLREQGMLDNIQQYDHENIASAGLWNSMTWVAYTLLHLVLVLVVTSPVNVYCLVLVVLLYLYSVGSLVSPRTTQRSGMDTVWTIMYFYAAFTVFQEMPVRHGLRLASLVLVTAMDLLLVLGHTYDATPTMLCAGNCRLLWTSCAGGVLLLLYYGQGSI